MIFQTEKRNYYGATALEIVRAMESDADDYPYRGQSIRQFLRWSLRHSGNQLPPREMDLSDRMDDESLALNYLYLCDEYGVGKVLPEYENGNRHSSFAREASRKI